MAPQHVKRFASVLSLISVSWAAEAFGEASTKPTGFGRIVENVRDVMASRKVLEYERDLEGRYLLQKAYLTYQRGRLTDMGDSIERDRIMKEAVGLAEKAVRLAPQSIKARFVAGLARNGSAHFGEAVRHLSRIPKSSPFYGEAICCMANAYASMSGASIVVCAGDRNKTKEVDADPKMFLIEKGQSATRQNRLAWIRKAKEYASKAKALLKEDPKTELTLGHVLRIGPRVREGSYAVPTAALACFRRYLRRVQVDELSWRHAQYALMFVEDAPPEVRKRVELFRGRSPSWVRGALGWARHRQMLPKLPAIAKVMRLYCGTVRESGLPTEPLLMGHVDELRMDCMGQLTGVAHVVDAEIMKDALSQRQRLWSLDKFKAGPSEDGLQPVKSVLNVVRQTVRADEKHLLKNLSAWEPAREQRAAHVIADAEGACEIGLGKVDQTAVNAMFRPVKLVELKVSATGPSQELVKFIKAVEASAEPVICRDLHMKRQQDGSYLLETTFVFLYRRKISLPK